MTDTLVVEAAEEMDYELVDDEVFDKIPLSKPARLQFASEPEMDVERFHEALDRHSWVPPSFPRTPGEESEAEYGYQGDLRHRGTGYKVNVKILSTGEARIYPRREEQPDVVALQQLVEAIEEGWNADLELLDEEEA